MAGFFTARLRYYADQLALQALRGAVLAVAVAAGAAAVSHITSALETLAYGGGRPAWMGRAAHAPVPPAGPPPCRGCMATRGGTGI